MRWHQIEELDEVLAEHPDAPDRSRLPHRQRVRAAVDVDVPTHRVDLAEAVEADGTAREPQDAGEDPVAVWIARAELRRPDLARRAPSDENRVERHSGA